MKKASTYLLPAIIGALLVWLLWSEYQTEQALDDSELYNFSIADTSAITKFVIWDKSPDTVVLERQADHWLVNGKHHARPDAIEVLLETMYRIRLRNFPQSTAQETILRAMGAYGKHVDVYQGGTLAKSFTVGTETPDMLGTYMLRDGFDTPVATHLPGFNGYLSSRFFIREDLWRTREIFPSKNPIASVSLVYPDTAVMEIKLQEDTYQLVGNNGESMRADDMASQALFKAIQQVQYEGMIIPSDLVFPKKDSIASSIPVAFVSVEYQNGQRADMRLYHVPGGPDILDGEGNPQEWDPDRFYALLSDGRFVLTQRYGLQHVLKSFRAFTPKN